MKTKRISFLAMFIMTFALPALASDASGGFTRNLKVSGNVDLDITTGSGDINIRRGDGGSVNVVAKIKANDSWLGSGPSAQEKVRMIEQNPPVKQNGNTISIGHIDDRELRRNVSISYEVTVPSDSRVHSETGSGDMRVEDVKGPVRASTGSGNVTTRNIGDELRVNTGS